ncbi:MAG: PQQ-binding-like beta-propeller repeat protein [Planctomycetota bacterium]
MLPRLVAFLALLAALALPLRAQAKVRYWYVIGHEDTQRSKDWEELKSVGSTVGPELALAATTQQDGASATDKEPRVAWKHAPAGCSFEDLITDGRTLFVLDRGGSIQALDPESGIVKWESKEALAFGRGFGLALSPAADFDALLVGHDEGLVALRRDNGEKIWRTGLASGVAGPACTERAVFAGGADGKVHALDLRTGDELWSADCMEDRPDDPPGFDGANARFAPHAARPGAARTDGHIVIVPIFDQCRVVAVECASGKRAWDFRTQGWTYGGVAIGDHNAFVVSQDEHLYAVDKAMGKEAWRIKTNARNEASAAAAGRFAYVGSCDGNLRAVDEVVGQVVWKFAIEPDAEGNTPIYGVPVVHGDAIVLAAMPGVVYAVDRKKGTLRWKLRPATDSELNGDLVAIGARLFATTRMNGEKGESGVFAIDPP